MKVQRQVDTDDGPVTVEVEACKHRIPVDESCADCEYDAWAGTGS